MVFDSVSSFFLNIAYKDNSHNPGILSLPNIVKVFPVPVAP